MPCIGGRANQCGAGVAHARGTGVADERGIALLERTQHARRLPHSRVLVVAYRRGADAKVRQQPPRGARVLRRDERHFA